MKKHLLFFAAVILLIVALSACGSKKEDSSAASESATTAPVSSDAAQEIKLIASAATFKYDQEEYKVKKGVPVKLTLEMKDGLHGARLADFNINLNQDNPTATFTPDKAGTFIIKCSVPCGNGHRTMTANLVVE
jgi:cytochrome c oxidase subunit 2